MTKIFTCRFILKNNSDYKDLEPVFRDILNYILKENEHFQTPEEADMREMFIELNMQDIIENRKPEGYNRKAKYKLVFPLGRKEFYVKQFAQKGNDIKRIGNAINDFLSTANIDYEMKYDYTVDCIPGSEGTFTLVDHNTDVAFPTVYEYGKTLRANIKIKKAKKNAKFGYITNGVFHELTVVDPSEKIEMDFEICDDISFGYQ
ncbi:MAG: hypothetical protein J5673_03685 [Candidatus Methanomethylophilaceae archaeon]|nr:hypothetical protein [Candidatus Methanomethylophilaceae archaeon]MBQ6548285.1 hypothetical protein [Candidatus Methanomethylophilaceae archaeon]